jgi:hypothetical protein
MATLHDEAARRLLIQRIERLQHDSPRRWGRMSVGQMLWHVNEAMAQAIGQIEIAPERRLMPGFLIKFMVLNLPWPKGAPTTAAFVATEQHDFEAERARCLNLIEALAARPLDQEWPHNPVFGAISGRDVSRLHAKHLNHHLTQFGV